MEEKTLAYSVAASRVAHDFEWRMSSLEKIRKTQKRGPYATGKWVTLIWVGCDFQIEFAVPWAVELAEENALPSA